MPPATNLKKPASKKPTIDRKVLRVLTRDLVNLSLRLEKSRAKTPPSKATATI